MVYGKNKNTLEPEDDEVFFKLYHLFGGLQNSRVILQAKDRHQKEKIIFQAAKQLGIRSYINSQGWVFQYLNLETGSRLHFAKEFTQPSNQKTDFIGLTGLKGRFLKKVDDIWSSYQTYDWVTSAPSPHQITKFSSGFAWHQLHCSALQSPTSLNSSQHVLLLHTTW